MAPSDGSRSWRHVAAFSACVFFAPALVCVAAVALLARDVWLVHAVVLLVSLVALVGALVLALLLRLMRPLGIPVLVLIANLAGFGGAALMGLGLPLVWTTASGSWGAADLGAAVGGSSLFVAFIAIVVFLAIGGPLWVAASAIAAAPLVLPREVARARSGGVGRLFLAIGTVVAVIAIALAWVSGAGAAADRCTYGGEAAFSWFPLGVACVSGAGADAHTALPDVTATIVVICGLALAALGAAMAVRSRVPRPPTIRVPLERWDAAENPWA